MYKLTDIMIQNFENDLKKFHELFRGGRCEAWQLEELIVKAIKSDYSKSERVTWKGRGHDTDKDVQIIDNNGKINDIQIKSGKIMKEKIIVSGHRTGRFNGNLSEITNFLNSNKYDSFIIPYRINSDNYGNKFIYRIFYVNAEIFKIDKEWKYDGNKYITYNSKGLKILLVPKMSWQVWWEIPLSIINEKTREIII